MMIPTDAFVRFEKSQQIVTSAQDKETMKWNAWRFRKNVIFPEDVYTILSSDFFVNMREIFVNFRQNVSEK
jgi:hypothetical protein